MTKKEHKIGDAAGKGCNIVAAYKASRSARLAVEASRLSAIRDAGAIPEECGSEIVAAPARGGFVLVRNIELLPVGTDRVEAAHRGYGGRSAIRDADVFDRMIASSLRRKQPCPLTPGQIAMARRYAALTERARADGTSLSKLDASFRAGDNGGWMDRHLQVAQELSLLKARIGGGVAMAVRRVRPSTRGEKQRGPILDRVLVDMVCIKGHGFEEVLTAHGWAVKGGHRKAIAAALSAALDRMIGYRPAKSS